MIVPPPAPDSETTIIVVDRADEEARPGNAIAAELLHICCPAGHELETPREMLGHRAECPECGAQFRLRRQDSLEFKQERQAAVERHRREAERRWVRWSAAILVLVVLVVAILVTLSALR
jgi:hypothetical protein